MSKRKQFCDEHDDGGRSVYTLRCALTGESQEVVVCMKHAETMPLIDGDCVTARPAESGVRCDFAPERGSKPTIQVPRETMTECAAYHRNNLATKGLVK